MVYKRDLWYVVNSVKADLDLNNTNHDLKFLKWSIDGYRELNLGNVLPNVRTVKLTLDSDNSALLPDDYVDFIKVGVCRNGYFINFDLNERICFDRKDPCCPEEIETTILNPSGIGWWAWEWWYMNFWHNGQPTAGIYGLGEGFYRGGYRIDEELRKIKFDRYVTAESAILEYESDGGIGEFGNAYIPEFAIRPLTNFVHRQRCSFSRDPMEKGDAQMFGRRWAKGFKSAVAKVNSLTQPQILSIWRDSIQQLPKR